MAHSLESTGASASKVNVSSYRHENWRMGGPQPLIVNPQADLHALLAWCWGEAADLNILASECCGETDMDTQTLASLFYGRMPALVSVLEHLGNETVKGA